MCLEYFCLSPNFKFKWAKILIFNKKLLLLRKYFVFYHTSVSYVSAMWKCLSVSKYFDTSTLSTCVCVKKSENNEWAGWMKVNKRVWVIFYVCIIVCNKVDNFLCAKKRERKCDWLWKSVCLGFVCGKEGFIPSPPSRSLFAILTIQSTDGNRLWPLFVVGKYFTLVL